MIYYIVSIDAQHNETVLSSHDDPELAAQKIDTLRDELPGLAFRIDTVPSNEEIRERNKQIPAKADYNEMLISQAGDYTARDLFGNQLGYQLKGADTIYFCMECGSVVASIAKHTDWHNKLLP